MYSIQTTNRFEKDAVACLKRGLDIDLLEIAIQYLEKSGTLSAAYKPHKLKGNYSGHYEAHLSGDWLLIWTVDKELKIITLIRTGSHSNLFK